MREVDDRIKDIKEGDYVYKISEFGVIPVKINKISPYGWLGLENNAQVFVRKSKIYYYSEDEAKEVLAKREKDALKKKKMYEYECKLNEELGTEGFLIRY